MPGRRGGGGGGVLHDNCNDDTFMTPQGRPDLQLRSAKKAKKHFNWLFLWIRFYFPFPPYTTFQCTKWTLWLILYSLNTAVLFARFRHDFIGSPFVTLCPCFSSSFLQMRQKTKSENITGFHPIFAFILSQVKCTPARLEICPKSVECRWGRHPTCPLDPMSLTMDGVFTLLINSYHSRETPPPKSERITSTAPVWTKIGRLCSCRARSWTQGVPELLGEVVLNVVVVPVVLPHVHISCVLVRARPVCNAFTPLSFKAFLHWTLAMNKRTQNISFCQA